MNIKIVENRGIKKSFISLEIDNKMYFIEVSAPVWNTKPKHFNFIVEEIINHFKYGKFAQ